MQSNLRAENKTKQKIPISIGSNYSTRDRKKNDEESGGKRTAKRGSEIWGGEAEKKPASR